VLVVLHAWRLLAFRAAMAADLADPGLGFGYFTFIAGRSRRSAHCRDRRT
jgi:hypothetical protein